MMDVQLLRNDACVCERESMCERESVCVCLCAFPVCVFVCLRAFSVCMCVCVCERESRVV